MQYKPIASKVEQGMFEFKGEMIDIYASTENVLYRIMFDDDTIEFIQVKDALTFKELGNREKITLRPASQYLQDTSDLNNILFAIENEMNLKVADFIKQGKLLEANRLEKRVKYDIRMIKETGFTNGIENYSLYFDGRMPGEAPNTIFDYFPDDMMIVVDESHMSIPQLKSMPNADRSRKINLIDHGFRLPSAIDHRPLNFDELEVTLRRNQNTQGSDFIQKKQKSGAKTLFVSATPSPYEFEHSATIAEQIIRPTGLLDPITYVYPKS
jgi:excinuclease ABC subunit B